MPSADSVQDFLARYTDWLWRHRKAVVAAAVAILLGGALYARRLGLNTSFTELLPQDAESVLDLRRLSARMVSTDLLLLAVEGDDPDGNRRAADLLAAEVAKLPPRLVARVKHRVDEERAFFERHKWLYPDLADLEGLRDRIESEIAQRKNPLLISLDDEDEGADPAALEKKYRDRAAELQRFSSGYIAEEGGGLYVVMIWPPDTAAAEGAGDDLAREARKIIERLDLTRRFGAKVTLAGNIETSIEERAALIDDLVLASTVCTILVVAVIVFYFRSFRSLVYIGFPSLIGVAAAFAFAEAAFDALNMSTAFLGSIILGNGINFPIVFLSRYAEDVHREPDVRGAVRSALRNTWLPTLVAASAASVAYGSLTLTSFRGFSQFGAIGGVGMLLCWLAAMTALPGAVLFWEGRPGARVIRVPRHGAFAGPAARLIRHTPRGAIALGLAISAAAVIPLPDYLRDPLEYNFRNLRNRKTQHSGLARATRRIDDLFGRALTPAAVLASRADQVPAIKQVLLRQDAKIPAAEGGPVLDNIETVESLLPGDLATQRAKIAVLDEIRKLLDDPDFALLDAEDRDKLAKLRPPDGLAPIAVGGLPDVLRRRFQEKDGTLGRILYLYPNKTFSTWRGKDILRFAKVTRHIPLPGGETIRSSSNSVIFADVLATLERDAPRATLFSFGAVLVLVILLTRSARGTAMVAGTLCMGVLWMVGAAALRDEKVNFLNFVALPITFGIGVDYAVNVYARYRAEGPGAIFSAVRQTGGAVVLCSATTIIGYGALLVADNRGLESFGALAILGEFACLATGLIVMPAIVEQVDRRRAARAALRTAR